MIAVKEKYLQTHTRAPIYVSTQTRVYIMCVCVFVLNKWSIAFGRNWKLYLLPTYFKTIFLSFISL